MTRVPAGIVIVPGVPWERVNSTSPTARPPVTRRSPRSDTTLSSAPPDAESTNPDR